MRYKKVPDDKKYQIEIWLARVLRILLVVGGVFLLLYFIRILDDPSLAEWAGFGEVETSTGEVLARRTLWDWLELLIIPAVLAGGALWINRTQRSTELSIAKEERIAEQQIAKDRQEQISLENYYDRMAELLLDHDLRNPTSDDDKEEERSIARARTLSVLRNLNAVRKGQVMRFLYESKLVDIPEPVVILREANLRMANLRMANLNGADLRGAELRGADLHGAELRGADLRGADLSEAYLSGTDLRGANLSGNDLREAYLSKTILRGKYLREDYPSGADLSGADLSEANLSENDLSGANLSEANLNEADLHWANLYMTNLSEANLSGADLYETNLSEANLSGADLSGASLNGAKLRMAYLYETNLSGAYLNGADLHRANLSGSLYNTKTTWPDGYNPGKKGSIQLDNK